jgi:hypothetical protein
MGSVYDQPGQGIGHTRAAHAPAISVRVAATAAYAAAATNLIAAGAMLLLLRHGLPVPGSTPAERLRFITEHTTIWRTGWLF